MPEAQTSSPRLLNLFLCHSSRDKAAVRALYRRLKDDGFDPWLDEEKLLPGQDWSMKSGGPSAAPTWSWSAFRRIPFPVKDSSRRRSGWPSMSPTRNRKGQVFSTDARIIAAIKSVDGSVFDGIQQAVAADRYA